MKYLKIPLLALALTPVIYHPGAFFPYIFPKTLFIRLMVTVFWAGFAALFLTRRPPVLSSMIAPLRSPVVRAVSAFLALAAASTIFAVHPYRAFWGDVERGEGLASLLFYFGFFIAALFVYAEKDWRRFFALTLIPFGALFIDQLWVFVSGHSLFSPIAVGNPTFLAGSLVGNPTFLAAFYLFVIFAAGMLLAGSKIPDQRPHRVVALLIRFGLGIVILLAALGIFISTTRGAIAGLAAGGAAVLALLTCRRDTPPPWRRIAAALLAAGVLGIAVFAATRHAAFWQKIPGVRDIAQLSWNDQTLQTRLTAALIAKHAMTPANAGIGRILVGWGPESFSYVFQKFYEPRYLRFEALWFDRAHNKLLDVLVMNGLLGLAAYLAIWCVTFPLILRGHNHWESAALLFFGVSYFTQNVFAFDTVATYIPFFAFLAYAAWRQTQMHAEHRMMYAEKDQRQINNRHQSASKQMISIYPHQNILGILAGIAALFYAIISVVTLIAFGQVLRYVPAVSSGRMDAVYKNFERITVPRTYVQQELRVSMLSLVVTAVQQNRANIGAARPLLEKAFSAAKETTEREGWNSRAYAAIAVAYEALDDFASAETYWKKALEVSPRRQELLYSLALNYARRGDDHEAMRLAKEFLALDPEAARARMYYAVIRSVTGKADAFDEATRLAVSVFDGPVKFYPAESDLKILRTIFQFYLAMFYEAKERDRFLAAMERAKTFEERYEAEMGIPPARSLEIQKGIDAFKENGWEAIRVEG